MGVMDDAERFEPASLTAWSDWLSEHHAGTPGVWLVTHKASTGLAAFAYEEAIVEASTRRSARSTGSAR